MGTQTRSRTRSRVDLRWMRRTQHFQDKLAAVGPVPVARVAVMSDWLRAVLVEAPLALQRDVADQVVRSLLSAVARIEQEQKGNAS